MRCDVTRSGWTHPIVQQTCSGRHLLVSGRAVMSSYIKSPTLVELSLKCEATTLCDFLTTSILPVLFVCSKKNGRS